jgi:hypothetical protein
MTPAAQQCWTAACKGQVGGWPRVGRRALAGSARSSSLHSSGSAAGPCLSSRCSGGRHSQYFQLSWTRTDATQVNLSQNVRQKGRNGRRRTCSGGRYSRSCVSRSEHLMHSGHASRIRRTTSARCGALDAAASPPPPPTDAPCTQCLRNGDPMHARKARKGLTLGGIAVAHRQADGVRGAVVLARWAAAIQRAYRRVDPPCAVLEQQSHHLPVSLGAKVALHRPVQGQVAERVVPAPRHR